MTAGTRITIKFGPFAGFRGVIASTLRERIVVRIILKGRSLLLELDKQMIEPADSR